MNVTGLDKLEEFKKLYPKSKKPLENWLRIVQFNDFKHPPQLKQAFNSVDFVKGYTVFDIGGNNYRLIAVVVYIQGALRILHILTHEEYDRGKWRKMEENMTTLTIEKKVKKYRKMDNHLFQTLILRLQPQPIKDKSMHKAYSDVLEMLAELLAEGSLTGYGKEAIEIYFGSVSHFVAEYEREIYPLAAGTPEEMLRFFIEQSKLKQADLADELGGQPVVSDILNGQRKLNREQIERLARRFHVSPGTFFKAA